MLTIAIKHFWLDLMGKTTLMLKIFSRISERGVYIITKSPPELYSTSKIKITEIGKEEKHVREYEKAIKVFADNSGSRNSSYIDQFFKGDRH